jgi:hypothetical protein
MALGKHWGNSLERSTQRTICSFDLLLSAFALAEVSGEGVCKPPLSMVNTS